MPQALLLVLCICYACLCGRVSAEPEPPIPRPDHTEHAKLARWLAHYNTWGTLATKASSDAAASAGVVSYADGGPLDSPAAGRMFFYLTPMDETGGHIQVGGSWALLCSCVAVLAVGTQANVVGPVQAGGAEQCLLQTVILSPVTPAGQPRVRPEHLRSTAAPQRLWSTRPHGKCHPHTLTHTTPGWRQRHQLPPPAPACWSS